MHDLKQNACSFLSVVVISAGAKNKVLKVVRIRLHTRRENFFSPNYWSLLSQKVDMSNHCQKTHACWSENASRKLGLWEGNALCNFLDDTPECSRRQCPSMSSWHMFVSIFETSFKYSILST